MQFKMHWLLLTPWLSKSGPLSWLLLCWAARTCTLSPPMSCLCFTCLRRHNLFSCVHGPKSAPLSWLLLRFTACTCTLSLLCHVSALKVWETQIALAVVAGGTRQRRLNRMKRMNRMNGCLSICMHWLGIPEPCDIVWHCAARCKPYPSRIGPIRL